MNVEDKLDWLRKTQHISTDAATVTLLAVEQDYQRRAPFMSKSFRQLSLEEFKVMYWKYRAWVGVLTGTA